MSAPLHWGIASAGRISHDFCVALSTLPAEDHKVMGVAARQKDRAEEFAKKHSIPNAFGSYEELAKSPNVNIVYIGTLNPQHFEVSKLMLENGKHVLCEKPLCMNSKQSRELTEFARSKNLFLMEAIWSRFFPAYQYVRKQIDSGVLGDIKEVEVSFGFPLTESDRVQKKDYGGGVVLDLGTYTIQCSQWIFKEPPQKIVAQGELNSDGVDVHVKSELYYAGGGVSKMTFSAHGLLDNNAVIKGTKGQITILQTWCPTNIIDVDGKEKSWPLPKGTYPTNFPNSEGLRYEAEAVRQSILKGELQNENVTHEESLIIDSIRDEIRKQIGVTYDVD